MDEIMTWSQRTLLEYGLIINDYHEFLVILLTWLNHPDSLHWDNIGRECVPIQGYTSFVPIKEERIMIHR